MADLTNEGGVFTAGRLLKNFEGHIRVFRRNDQQELTFAGDMKGIETEQLACATHGVAKRNAFFKQQHAQVTIAGQFIQRGGHTAAGGIAHPTNAGAGFFDQSLNERKHGAGIGGDFTFQIELAAGEKDSDAVIADGAADQHFIAGANRGRRNRDAWNQSADAGGCDIHAIRFAVFDNFCIAA